MEIFMHMHTVSARAHLYTYNKFLELRKLESSPIDHLTLQGAEESVREFRTQNIVLHNYIINLIIKK